MARQQQDLVAKVIKQAHKLAEAGPITASPHKSIGYVLSVTDLKPSRRLTENLNLNHLTRSKSEMFLTVSWKQEFDRDVVQ